MESNQRRTLLYGVIGAVVVALVVVGGVVFLGGDDNSAKKARTQALRTLEAKRLAPTDLPAGYAAGQPASSGTARCIVGQRTEREGRTVNTRADFRSTPAGKETQLSEVLALYKAGQTGTMMAKARALAADCASFTDNVSGKDVAFKTATLPFPTLLDETVAYQVTGTADGTPVVFDQIFMRSGDTVVVLVHGGTGGVDTTVTDQIARKAAEKVARPA